MASHLPGPWTLDHKPQECRELLLCSQVCTVLTQKTCLQGNGPSCPWVPMSKEDGRDMWFWKDPHSNVTIYKHEGAEVGLGVTISHPETVSKHGDVRDLHTPLLSCLGGEIKHKWPCYPLASSLAAHSATQGLQAGAEDVCSLGVAPVPISLLTYSFAKVSQTSALPVPRATCLALLALMPQDNPPKPTSSVLHTHPRSL